MGSINTRDILLISEPKQECVRTVGAVLECSACRRYFTDLEELKQHYKDKHEIHGCYPCNYVSCTETFKSEDARSCHQRHTHPELMPIYCRACRTRPFKTKEELEQHEIKCSRERSYQCAQCFWGYKLKHALSNHINRRCHKGMICRICQKIFTDKKEYFEHIDEENNKIYVCEHCGNKYKKYTRLRQHVSRMHEKKLRECEICGWKTLRIDSYTHHMRIHKSGGYACEHCDFKAQTATGKRMHEETHRPLMCPQCNYVILGLDRMRTHYKRCKGVESKASIKVTVNSLQLFDELAPSEKFKCHGCQQDIKQSQLLKHFARKPACRKYHQCSYCSKNFKEMEHVKKHETMHKGPYICSYCKRGYTDWEKCSQHIVTHIRKDGSKRWFTGWNKNVTNRTDGEDVFSLEESIKNVENNNENMADTRVIETGTADRKIREEETADSNVKQQGTADSNVKQQVTADSNVKQQGTADSNVKQYRTTDTSVKRKGMADTSDKQEEIADTSVKQIGTTDTNVKQKGTADNSVKLKGTADASIKLKGIADTSVKLKGMVDTSDKQEGIADTSVKQIGTTDTNVKQKGTADNSVK